MPNDLLADAIQPRLKTAWLGREYRYFDQTGSTNTEAVQLAKSGAPHGTVVVADHQTAGRGRIERTWHSPPGENLYFSVLLRPQWSSRDARPVSLAAGVALAEAVAPRLTTPPTLKWPNDLLAGGKKLAGILVEGSMQAAAIEFVIVGVGLNVNTAEFPEELSTIAESLGRLVGNELDRGEVLADALNSLEPWLDTLAEQGSEPIVAAWLKHAANLGQRVKVAEGSREYVGVMQGVDPDGTLRLQLDDGQEQRIVSGDVLAM
ncbi:MAG: biotin--[acetyl-CoA-carboxylase] ligase [Planctomycetales bacterium]|nr:biotin--[acetyl-CoA-carboxylase] ligase [Planctomycetales bacterium]